MSELTEYSTRLCANDREWESLEKLYRMEMERSRETDNEKKQWSTVFKIFYGSILAFAAYRVIKPVIKIELKASINDDECERNDK